MIRCRYLGRRDMQCTAEVVDEQGEILLCTKHLGRAVELLNRHGVALAAALTATALATASKEN